MQPPNASMTRMQLSHRAADIYKAKKVGVALGPGLPIGLVDLGMLIALDQLKVKISMISATSMGAVMGALYASGLSTDEIREHVVDLFANDTIQTLLKKDMKIPGIGYSTAEKLIAELVRRTGWDPEFHELMVPLRILASDKVTQQSVVIRHGRVYDAVRASLAIPLIIEEKQMGGMRLADGAIFAPLDTQVLYSEGADFVLAIQAKPIRSSDNRKLTLQAKMYPKLLNLMGWQTSKDIYFSKPACDILLRPRVPTDLVKDGKLVDEIIELGIKITYDAFTEIEKGAFAQRDTYTVSEAVDAPPSDANINADLEKEAANIESYLNELTKKAGNMSDADIVNEFANFEKMFGGYLEKLTKANPESGAAADALKSQTKSLTKFVNDSPFLERCLSKPLGYAGDYQMMNYLYDDNIFEARSNIGKFLNYYTFGSPTSNAVRNRAKIVQGLLQQQVTIKPKLAVASIACGPAREVAETMKLIPAKADGVKITWSFLEQDQQALDYARSRLPDTPRLEAKIVNAGVRDLLKGKVALDQQDLIYTLGLFDYLEERVAVALIGRLYARLNPGGLLLIGNYSPNHPDYTFIEAVSDWYLIYRTEEELISLGKAGAPDARHFVMAEPEGLNLILVTSKPLDAQQETS